jgi:protein involved in polysaccharide export with SLBB domain
VKEYGSSGISVAGEVAKPGFQSALGLGPGDELEITVYGAPDLSGHMLPVELTIRKPPAEHQSTCGLAVVLPGGRRIEVQREFDTHTFERLMSVLERG